jgi:hypothetical protein
MLALTIPHPTAPVGKDKIKGGNHRIIGTVKVVGLPATPVARRVLCCETESGTPMHQQWSDPLTGAYSFTNIKPGSYYVIAFDHTGVHNGVVATGVAAEPMP